MPELPQCQSAAEARVTVLSLVSSPALTCQAIESKRVSTGNRTESDAERLRSTSKDGMPVLRVALKAAAEWMT
jgi:hypothetical protein